MMVLTNQNETLDPVCDPSLALVVTKGGVRHLGWVVAGSFRERKKGNPLVTIRHLCDTGEPGSSSRYQCREVVFQDEYSLAQSELPTSVGKVDADQVVAALPRSLRK